MLSLLFEGQGGFRPLEFVGGATLWTWIAFVLAMPLMWLFVFGPITKALASRDQKVEDSIKAAEEARKAAEQQVVAAKQQLDEARAEGRRMVDEALARAERQGQEALRAAKAEAEHQLKKAREAIDAERRQALAEIRKEVVGLTMAASARVLGKSVDDTQNRKLVQDFLGEVARN